MLGLKLNHVSKRGHSALSLQIAITGKIVSMWWRHHGRSWFSCVYVCVYTWVELARIPRQLSTMLVSCQTSFGNGHIDHKMPQLILLGHKISNAWTRGPIGVNTLRPKQNDHHFAADIFKCILLNEMVWISINISLKLVPGGSINNISVLVQIMAWRRPGDKPLSEPMMVRLPTHICVTRPQCVNVSGRNMVFVGHDVGWLTTKLIDWSP